MTNLVPRPGNIEPAPADSTRPLRGVTVPERTLRVGLLSNPCSFRNRRNPGAYDRLLHATPALIQLNARDPAEITVALNRLAGQDLDLLAINGGDGTIQAVLTSLLDKRPFDRLPLLAILAGGTTNMDAGDVGLRGRGPEALQRLLNWAANPDRNPAWVQRPVLRVQAGTAPPLYGMFFGAGAIVNGIEHFHGSVKTKGLKDALGPAVTIIRFFGGLLRKHSPHAVRLQADVQVTPGPAPGEREYFLVLASALERLFLGIHPHWGTTEGAFYFTAISAHPRHPLRALPSLLRGHANRFAGRENGYFSHKVDTLEICMDGQFTLDGELYPISKEDGPLRISGAGPVAFVKV